MFIRNVIRALEKNHVDFVIVGGYAVALHGVVRGTVDIDLVVALSYESFARVEKAMQQLGLQSRLPISAEDVFNYRDEYIRKRNLIAWSFVNPDNPLEVVDVIITADASNMDTIEKEAFGQVFRIASIAELIRMKRHSGRPQDIEDINALERLS